MQSNIKIINDKNIIIDYFKNNNSLFNNSNNLKKSNNIFENIYEILLSKYVVCQELLQNPYLIHNRKINIRIYLLIVIDYNKTSFYMYNDGFIYYSKKDFIKESFDLDVNITSAISDAFMSSPYTFQDLLETLSTEKSTLLFNNIKELMNKICIPYAKMFEEENKNIEGIKCNILGCDVAPDNELNVKIMEVNESPRLEWPENIESIIKQIKEIKSESSSEYSVFEELLSIPDNIKIIHKLIEKEIKLKKKLVVDTLSIIGIQDDFSDYENDYSLII